MAANPRPEDAPPAERPLPLEVEIEPTAGGWSIRLPLRAEDITVDKRTVETGRIKAKPICAIKEGAPCDLWATPAARVAQRRQP